MQPNTPLPLSTPQSSSTETRSAVDYLNQISTPVTQKPASPFIVWGLIGGFLLLLAGAVIFALNSGGPSYSEQLVSFIQRVNLVKKLTDSSAKKIQNTSLRGANSTLSLALTNVSRDATEIAASAGEKKITAAEKTSKLTKEFTKVGENLENGRLNNVFDRVYAREMLYQLATLRSELQTVRKRHNSKKLTEFATSTETNLAPLSDQLEKFNE